MRALLTILMHYRAATHPGTGFSPSEAMFGEHLRLPAESIFDYRSTLYNVDIDSTVKDLADFGGVLLARSLIKATNEKYRQSMAAEYD
jgi:hypothetical protein